MALNTAREPLPLKEGCEWGDENERTETAQSDLKQLMADVTRAMEKAQEAVARITSAGAGTTAGTETTNLNQLSNHGCTSRSAYAALSKARRGGPQQSSSVAFLTHAAGSPRAWHF